MALETPRIAQHVQYWWNPLLPHPPTTPACHALTGCPPWPIVYGYTKCHATTGFRVCSGHGKWWHRR